MGFRKNKYMTGMSSHKNAMKSLSVAALAGIASMGVAHGATLEDVDMSAKPLETPTLQYLHDNKVTYSKDTDADGVGDTDVVYPESGYTLTETTDTTLDNVITKYVYDETNATLTEKHYQVNLKQTTYGDAESGNTSVDTSVTVLGQPVTFTYNVPSDYTTATDRVTDLSTANVNKVLFQNISNNTNGGAIYNTADNSNVNITGDFIYNSSYEAGAIYNIGAIGDITGDFISNYAYSSSAKGGAIYNTGSSATIGNITGDFIGNNASSVKVSSSIYGGAIYNTGFISNITGDFISNYARSSSTSSSSSAYGGAIYNTGSIGVKDENGNAIGGITGDFIGNYVKASASSKSSSAKGGAIYNTGSSATIGNITGDFIGNYAQGSTYGASGGAIYNVQGSFGDIIGDFIGNYASSSSSSSAYGGAIYNTGSIGDITGDFIGNYAQGSSYVMGGAIVNSGSIGNITGNFIGNYALSLSSTSEFSSAKGGAINNIVTIGDITGDFIGNYAKSETSTAQGGAIYNTGSSATIGNITGDFIGNNASSVKVSSSIYGGAIYNTGFISNITGDFISNYARSSSTFSSSSAYGGAIYNTGSIGVKDENGNAIGGITGDFIGNYVKASASSKSSSAKGGAIYNGGAISITNSGFVDNYAKSESGTAQGGAIYTTKDLSIVAKDGYTSVFSGNYTESAGVKDDNAITLDNANLNLQMLNGGKFLMQDNITTTSKGVNAFYTDNGVSNFDEYAIAQGFKNTATDTFLAGEGYSTVNEFVKAEGFRDTPTETFLAMEGFSSEDEFLQATGFTSMDEFAASVGYETFEEFLKVEIGLYGDTPEEQFLNVNGGYETFDEFLKNEVGLSGDTATEQLLNIEGYSSVDEYISDQGYNSDTFPTVSIQGDDINNTTFYLFNDIRNANVNIGNTTVNTVNNLVHNYNFESLKLTADTNMVVDVDLANQTMDRFSANRYGEHQGNLNVTGMNLLSDATEDTTKILFAENGLKDNVTSSVGEVAYTPIYKYNVSYDKSGEDGYFVFDRYTVNSGSSGGSGSSNPSESFNPAVLGSSSSATVGALGTMNQTMNYAFGNLDTYMNIPYLERVSMKNRNKYALSLTGDTTGIGRYSPLYQKADEQASVWVKPYATFENVPLKNGPKVSNITYGTLVGFDSEMQSLRNGWDRVFTGYIGYNGASQRYSGIDSTQNGGLIGGTMTLYKGNFFNATTVSVGANVAQNQTMYGSEDFAMLLSGIGNKTGYNFEFKEGKVILQPSMLMSYTFVNTFDYTNAAGVRIDNKPLHALQLAPGVKVIGNLKNGWQPYASVSMVWNLMGESDATANGVKLPEMSIKPYVQYGVGLQKRIKDHFTAYGQAMIQNGGRNGISLTAGFRWALGHDCKMKDQKVDAKKQDSKILKQVQDDNKKKEILRSAQNDGSKKILKQMTPSQKAAHGGKYASTTRSAKAGMLRQL